MNQEMAVALAVAQALEAAGIRYLIGGSLASSFAGEPRSTLDVDMVAELRESAVAPLLQVLGDAFYADAASAQAAVRAHSSFNLIHEASGIKVDVFVSHGASHRVQMDRRRSVDVGEGQHLYFYAPEDILLQKLRWYAEGGQTSDRQWRDIAGIVATQGPALDRAYLLAQAPAWGVAELLTRALGRG